MRDREAARGHFPAVRCRSGMPIPTRRHQNLGLGKDSPPQPAVQRLSWLLVFERGSGPHFSALKQWCRWHPESPSSLRLLWLYPRYREGAAPGLSGLEPDHLLFPQRSVYRRCNNQCLLLWRCFARRAEIQQILCCPVVGIVVECSCVEIDRQYPWLHSRRSAHPEQNALIRLTQILKTLNDAPPPLGLKRQPMNLQYEVINAWRYRFHLLYADAVTRQFCVWQVSTMDSMTDCQPCGSKGAR